MAFFIVVQVYTNQYYRSFLLAPATSILLQWSSAMNSKFFQITIIPLLCTVTAAAIGYCTCMYLTTKNYLMVCNSARKVTTILQQLAVVVLLFTTGTK